ncbi:hypothetical protein TNIN_48621 [Trichonephila inaurata madagascariensis]|uniref:Uncharacterized protein n=1 Tax=Trichonephila inaurata madagascariensis TaxID=2747483 RepID=A0A8X6XAE6_9ARAC|nr:hypothetical protein TNIN_48621 [Trichonephila inaurata madagascariensis]
MHGERERAPLLTQMRREQDAVPQVLADDDDDRIAHIGYLKSNFGLLEFYQSQFIELKHLKCRKSVICNRWSQSLEIKIKNANCEDQDLIAGLDHRKLSDIEMRDLSYCALDYYNPEILD